MQNDNKINRYHLIESFNGKFSRRFNLPENVDKENIDASFIDGVLLLAMPKVEAKKKQNNDCN